MQNDLIYEWEVVVYKFRFPFTTVFQCSGISAAESAKILYK